MNIVYSILAEYLMLPRNHGTYFGNQLITRKIILNLHGNCDRIFCKGREIQNSKKQFHFYYQKQLTESKVFMINIYDKFGSLLSVLGILFHTFSAFQA